MNAAALAIALALGLMLLPFGAAGQFSGRVEIPTYGTVEGRYQVGLSPSGAFDARLDMKLVGEDGNTQFSPRLKSSWSATDTVDVRMDIRTGDLNADTSRTSVDTSVAFRPNLRAIDRVESSFRRADRSNNSSLKVRLARLNTGLSLLGGDSFGISTEWLHERKGARELNRTTVTSGFGIGSQVTMRSSVQLEDTQGSGIERSVLDTMLRYDVPVAFIDSVEGVHRRDVHRERQTLTLNFTELSGANDQGGAYRMSGKALLQEVARSGHEPSRSFGLETKWSGDFPGQFGGVCSVSLKLEQGLGSNERRHATLSYDHEWQPTEHARVELELNMAQRGDTLRPDLDVNWSARF